MILRDIMKMKSLAESLKSDGFSIPSSTIIRPIGHMDYEVDGLEHLRRIVFQKYARGLKWSIAFSNRYRDQPIDEGTLRQSIGDGETYPGWEKIVEDPDYLESCALLAEEWFVWRMGEMQGGSE